MAPLNSISFSDADIDVLQRIIETADQTVLSCQRELSGIWLTSEDRTETELRLLVLSNIKLTVSRVCFNNRRQGTMTKVYAFLKEFCVRNGISRIVIQAVETKEMASWCAKNGFQPDIYASFQLDGVILGDYIFQIEG